MRITLEYDEKTSMLSDDAGNTFYWNPGGLNPLTGFEAENTKQRIPLDSSILATLSHSYQPAEVLAFRQAGLI
jgi:hypothetical protein